MSTTVRVWTFSTGVTPELLARCEEVLDEAERQRAAAFARGTGRHRFVVAHGALRLLLGRELGVPPQRLRFTIGPHGKPETPGVHMSLSHCGDLVAVAASPGRPVGVDIQQRFRANYDAMAVRFFAPPEARHVAEAADDEGRADRFTRLWTRKEAVVKAAGGRLWPNLAMPVHDSDVVECIKPSGQHRVCDLAAPAGFRLAVALAGAGPYRVAPRPVPWSDAAAVRTVVIG